MFLHSLFEVLRKGAPPEGGAMSSAKHVKGDLQLNSDCQQRKTASSSGMGRKKTTNEGASLQGRSWKNGLNR